MIKNIPKKHVKITNGKPITQHSPETSRKKPITNQSGNFPMIEPYRVQHHVNQLLGHVQSTANNPLLNISGLPRFKSIRTEDIATALNHLLNEGHTILQGIITKDIATFNDVLEPLIKLDDRFRRLLSPVQHLENVKNSDAISQAVLDAESRIFQFYTELAQEPHFYTLLKRVTQNKDLTREQKRTMDKRLRELKLSGAELCDADDKKIFKQNEQRLIELSKQFKINVLKSTENYPGLFVSNINDLGNMPDSVLATAKAAAKNVSKKNAWKFGIKNDEYYSFMEYCPNRELRKQLYEAYTTRASAPPYDNTAVINEVLKLRQEQAQLLGFHNWGERMMVGRMAENIEIVQKFLSDFVARIKPVALSDKKELEKFVKEHNGSLPLETWDLAYWSRLLCESKFSFTDEEVRSYLPVDACASGLFAIIERLFPIKFVENSDVETWHTDVKYYDVFNKEGTRCGGLYMDLFVRDHKRGGAWMDVAVQRLNGERPVAYLNCDFAQSIPDKPSLLKHSDLETLFHEMGHALHHILTEINIPDIAGTNVAWDAAEQPSQLFENWAWNRESLDLITRHVQTNKILPRELFDKMAAAKKYQSGIKILRQLEIATVDHRLHVNFVPGCESTVQDVINEVLKNVAVFIPPSTNRFQNTFTHIFSGSYSAGYYSYLWALVLAADSFEKFEENGVFDSKTAMEFLNTILASGDSEEAKILFRRWRGRDPSLLPLMKQILST